MKKQVKISLATKFTIATVILIIFVMAFVIYAIHRTVTIEFTERYNREVQFSLKSIQEELATQQQLVRSQLKQLMQRIEDDHEFRLHTIVQNEIHHSYIVNYAHSFMPVMGVQVLIILDERGTVLSSGHFRQLFGSDYGYLVRSFTSIDQEIKFARFVTPEEKIYVLADLVPLTMAGRTFYVIGGIELSSSLFNRLILSEENIIIVDLTDKILSTSSPEIELSLLEVAEQYERDMSIPQWFREKYTFGGFSVPIIIDDAVEEATIAFLHPRTELVALLSDLNRRMFAITGVTLIFAVILSGGQSKSVTRPLQRLARTASQISLDKLEDNFTVTSNDEVGVLNNALKEMVRRLQLNKIDLAVAEQKAAMVEIARKVNHDIKNGFIPIRNVMEHWVEVAEKNPANLPSIFNERKGTVQESIAYLENLAGNYARFKPTINPELINISNFLQQLINKLKGLPNLKIKFSFECEQPNLFVFADKLQLQRAFENIIWNAVDATKDGGYISIRVKDEMDNVVIKVQDNGVGIPDDVRKILFVTPVTTKPEGTGIGLISTKHICEDFGGKVSIESEVDRGTAVTVRFPRYQSEKS